MISLLKTFALLVAVRVFRFSVTEENVNITRDAKSGGKLVVDVDFGTIDVAPGDNDKVVVMRRARSRRHRRIGKRNILPPRRSL